MVFGRMNQWLDDGMVDGMYDGMDDGLSDCIVELSVDTAFEMQVVGSIPVSSHL